MNQKRKTEIESAKQALLMKNRDPGFKNFLCSLDDEQLEVYLYIEAQRADCMIKHFTAMSGEELGLNSMHDNSNREKLPKGWGFEKTIENLLVFWELFGKSKIFTREIRKTVIELHNIHARLLTEEEIDFFLNC